MRYAIYVNGQEVENGTEPSTGGSIQGLPAGFNQSQVNFYTSLALIGFSKYFYMEDPFKDFQQVPISYRLISVPAWLK